MKESKFPLADLLTILGAVVFGFICFLSLNFISMGDTEGSITYAIIYTIVIAGLAYFAKRLKSTAGNFKRNIILERIVLIAYIFVSFIFIKDFSHYLNVFRHKDEIQQKVANNVSEVEGIFSSYEEYVKSRKEEYLGTLESAVQTKEVDKTLYLDFGFSDSKPDQDHIDNLMFILDAELMPTNYVDSGGIKNVATDWINTAEASAKNTWAFSFGVIDVIKYTEINANNWKKQFEEFSAFRMKNETADDFQYKYTFSDVTSEDLTNNRGISATGALMCLFIYLLMILPYIVGSRSSKSGYTLLSLKNKKQKIEVDNKVDIDMKFD